ncbi:MAG: hypothetical protein HPY61_14765 [Methanotrichaceae archaeon]|nr:hypothetical protein [Methanotrichaceae archaeon]
MDRGAFQLIVLGIIDVIIAIGGLYIWRFFKPFDTILAMIAILLAFITYFGFMAISQSLGQGWASNIGSMRTAIASGMLIFYFFILSIAIFFSSAYKFSEFSQTMINNLTTTIGIIIPFYFGASAYVQAQASSSSKRKENDEKASGNT